MSYVLGVDLGTTYTGVALGRDGHVEMVSLGDRSLVAPAVVFARADGELVTGDAAVRRALEEPGRSAREFKRQLGDHTPLLLGGTPYSPALLMATVLSAVIDTVRERNGEAPERVVLTRPAAWGPYRREQFDQVPRLIGLTEVEVLAEPVAAATYYAATKPHREDEKILVYDLGGGTFDATVVRLHDGQAEILGEPEGIDWLGGIDFDDAVLDHVDQATGGAVSALDLTDDHQAGLMTRLRQECVLAKEALSVEEEVVIRAALPSGDIRVSLSRKDFEDRISPALTATIAAVHRVLDSAKLSPPDLSAVLLVGGSSRIPLIGRLLGSALNRPIVVDTHPKHAVALGAAMIAGTHSSRASPADSIGAKGRSIKGLSTGGPAGGRRWINRRRAYAGTAALVTLGLLGGLLALDARHQDDLSSAGGPTTSPATTTSPTAGASPSPTSPSATPPTGRASAGAVSLTLPPVNARFDFQIGGAYPPLPSVGIVVRDRRDGPVSGKYTICYVNGFQTQADAATFWSESHPDLLLKGSGGKPIADPGWPDENLLDTSTPARRKGIATVVNGWIDDCAQQGFAAIDLDNLDSWTRSGRRLSAADNVALAKLLTAHAHSKGLAVAQHNAPDLGSTGKDVAKFDFALAEECQLYGECNAYTGPYGKHVIDIEYTDNPRSAYRTACAALGRTISVILRDRDVVPVGQDGYHYEAC